MSRTRVRIDPDDRRSLPPGRVDHAVLDQATEADLAVQQRHDDAEAMKDMAQYARRVRRRLGLTQVEFARRIDVPRETIRNWEQGKRCPTGAAPGSRQGAGGRSAGAVRLGGVEDLRSAELASRVACASPPRTYRK